MAQESPQLLAARIGRSRDAIAASRASISRARDRISESLRLVAHPRGFCPPPVDLTDEQLGDVAVRWAAATEQRQIDSEVRQSVWGDLAMPGARLRLLSGD